MIFHDDWYSDAQLVVLADSFRKVSGLTGAVMEIGCWEGKSTCALARACAPETLIAIDTWKGNYDENPAHGTVTMAAQRDIYAQFLENIAGLPNVKPVQMDCHEFLKSWDKPVKFAHIDASHDYKSVHRTIAALLPWLVKGGILCGDDIATASADRIDLGGGVERAVRELLPGFRQDGNFWSYQLPT